MILFGCWAPSEQAFWDSWIAAGICTAPHVFAAGYQEIQTTAGAWDGVVTRDGVAVPGWHCNCRVWGNLEAQFTAGLAQTDANGNLKPLFERTHAAQIFGLTQEPANSETGFPAGYRNTTGVTYADVRDFSSPSNVWA